MYQDHDDTADCPDVFFDDTRENPDVCPDDCDDERDEDGNVVWPDERWTLTL